MSDELAEWDESNTFLAVPVQGSFAVVDDGPWRMVTQLTDLFEQDIDHTITQLPEGWYGVVYMGPLSEETKRDLENGWV